VHDVAGLSAFLAYDSRLGTAVDEGLDGMSVDLDVDVEHGDVSKQLRCLVHCLHVVLLNHRLSDFFFDHLLSLNIVGVCVVKLHNALLLCPLLRHHLLHSFSYNLLNLVCSFLRRFGECLAQLGVVLVKAIPKELVLQVLSSCFCVNLGPAFLAVLRFPKKFCMRS
jgi:hypothetical protein